MSLLFNAGGPAAIFHEFTFMSLCRRALQRTRPYLVTNSPVPTYLSCRNISLFNPVDWVKEKLLPTEKIAEDEEKIKAAKEQAKKEGTANLFEDIATPESDQMDGLLPRIVKKHKSHKYSTANFKISHRKLNMLGRQIAGKPIDHAILQMQFSEKRAGSRIMNMLVTARDHAYRYKGLEHDKLVVAEAWVNKGARPPARVEPRGRGHYGMRRHPRSKMVVVLKEGKMIEEQKAAAKKRKLARIVSATVVRESKPIRNPSLSWGW